MTVEAGVIRGVLGVGHQIIGLEIIQSIEQHLLPYSPLDQLPYQLVEVEVRTKVIGTTGIEIVRISRALQ